MVSTAGVTILTPREPSAGHIDEEEEIEAFLTRFRERADLTSVFGLDRFILRGEVEERDVSCAVRVGSRGAPVR